jgi:hypothetical protein
MEIVPRIADLTGVKLINWQAMKARKGIVFRPCHVCRDSVNFIFWKEESKRRRKRIFHWANPDGSHHVHSSTPTSIWKKNSNQSQEVVDTDLDKRFRFLVF